MPKRSLKSAAVDRRMELAEEEIKKPVNTGIQKPRKTGTQEDRIKCTYDLAPDTVEALEEARLKLRRITGRNVKRYEIIEAALALALEDLEKVADRL